MSLLFLAGTVHAQPSDPEVCNTVRVLPFPINAERSLTAQVRRGCNLDADTLETVEAFVLGDTIRIETTCRTTILPSTSCQVGQVGIGILAPGEYAIDVVDQASGNLLFRDAVRVGRVTAIPTLKLSGLAILAASLLGVAARTAARQAGRNRFSNSRS